MAVRLTIDCPAEEGAELVRSFVQDRIVIGRARHCDVCLPDLTVSTRHAEIEVRGSDYVVVDQGSLNGTRVNGKPLVALRPRVLKNGDCVEIAGFALGFRLGVSPGPAEPRDESMRQARTMVLDALARSGQPAARRALLVVDGPGKASRFELPDPPATLVIGRAKEAEIRLDDREISRYHAELVLEVDGAVRARDLGSRSGIVVGAERIDEHLLEPGHPFKLGHTSLLLEHPADEPLIAILEAPEEATSSYSPLPLIEAHLPTVPPAPAPPAGGGSAADEAIASPPEPPPVGPADPLAYPGQPGYVPTEREIPRPELSGGSDVGLIVVGAIIVVAAVIGLVLLFT
jgi:pSer/pThr/pTyr-binding forkhead associated (FHA) protein